MWEAWQDREVGESGDAPEREDLDVWQKFLYDILEEKAMQWEEAVRTFRQREYKPARVIGAGTAGTGKSRTIRAIVKRRRVRAKASGKSGAGVSQCCTLAAPTGCAG